MLKITKNKLLYFLAILFLYFVFATKVLALEIVYPKTNLVKINAPSTFFIGSTNPTDTLKINDIEVKVSQLGAFAQMVPLDYGLNNFKIISNSDTINFVIERPQPAAAASPTPQLIEYPPMNNFYVIKDSSVLRSTSVDGGINRLSHLPKDTQIIINGEKGDFYRVYLNSNLYAWIKKSEVEQRQICPEKITLKDFKTKETREFCLYEFKLSGKTPFILKEENGLTLQLFNVEGQEDNTYCINIPIEKLFGYDIFYKEDKLILKLRKFPEINCENPLKHIVIAVDAGHGGKENGAIGGCGDKEKDINLAIAKNLEQELKNRGAKVIMTREEDKTVSLQDRVDLAKKKDAAILLSIHANALPDGQDPIKNRGTSVYYYHNQAKNLAENILNSMTIRLGTQNDRVRQGSLALVRPTSSVSVLIEVAYIINPDDYALLLDKTFQQNCAKAIADGIETYILKLYSM